MNIPLIKSLFEAEKRDTDYGNMDGWEASIDQVWPEAKITRKINTRKVQWLAHVVTKCVGEWDMQDNKGYVAIE